MAAGPPVLRITGLRKRYQGLRPLRIQALEVGAGERVAIAGLDLPAGETLVNLMTGATLPDEGEVAVLGVRTADIASEADWLTWLDRFGIVSARAVLVDAMTLAQNLALPFTLSVDPLAPDVRSRVDALAAEVGLPREALDTMTGEADPQWRARVHLARAVALEPSLLVLEHPAAMIGPGDPGALAGAVDRVARGRSLTVVALLAAPAFGKQMGARVYTLRPGTGTLEVASRWKRWC